MALSISHGTLVAPSTRRPSRDLPTPFIWIRNSVLMRREDSFSPPAREEHSESISSMKITEGSGARGFAWIT